MLTAQIRDYQVVTRADINVGDGITLIAGENARGKSSLAKAMASALTGTTLPGGLKKKDVKSLIRDGAKAAGISIVGPDGSVTVSYPKAEITTAGTPPSISRMAAGFESLVEMKPEDRASALAATLKTAPTRDDLVAALADLQIFDAPPVEEIDAALKEAGKVADPALTLVQYSDLMRSIGMSRINIVHWLWWQIECRGWDDTTRKLEAERTELKNRWCGLSGEAFGDKKKDGWTPAGWTPDLDEATKDDLEAAVAAAQMALETAIAEQAVNAAEIERHRAEAAKLPTAQKSVEEARTAKESADAAMSEAEGALREAEKALAGLPAAGPDHHLTCPHCSGAVRYQHDMAGGTLAKAEPIPEATLEQRRTEREEAEVVRNRRRDEHAKARSELTNAVRALDDADRALNAARTAAENVREMEAAAAGKTGSVDDVTAAREGLATATKRLALFRLKTDTDVVTRRINVVNTLIDIAAKDGLRQAKLQKVLDTFNEGVLEGYCKAAGWKPVKVEADMSVTLDGRSYDQLGGLGPQITSDQFKIRAVLQVALTKLSGESMVILDAADVLVGDSRNGLYRLIQDAGIDAVVCMSFARGQLERGAVHDLERHKLGRTYWLQDGTAQPLASVMAEIEASRQKAA